MDPQEPGPGPSVEPGQGSFDHGLGLSLDELEIEGGPGAVFVVIDIEAAVEPEAGVKGEGADEGPRRIALVLEERRQIREFGRHLEIAVVVDAVAERRRSEQDIGVGREGQRRMGEGPAEHDARPARRSMFGVAPTFAP